MPLPVYRLRRILATTAILLTAIVAGMYFYARSRATNVLKSIPNKIGYDIKQTASGFQFSKSDGKRTLFTIQASDLKEFKLNGNAELHKVSIVLYGRDSSRFDQIYGDDFAYNQKTGIATAMGDVQIDLVANPAGLASPDQSVPRQVKNPIHLKTRDLVFDRNTGNAMTEARVEFHTPKASGWAVGVRYVGKTNTLILSSQIHIELSVPTAMTLVADRGVVTGDPREITLEHACLTRQDGSVQAGRATFLLGSENNVERVLATEGVTTETRTAAKGSAGKRESADQVTEVRGRADQAEFLLARNRDVLQTAALTGNVHFDTGRAEMQGEAGRVVLEFAGQNQLQKVHALENVHLVQKKGSVPDASPLRATSPSDFDLAAPEVDFLIQGRILRHASTSGAAQIILTQSGAVASPAQRTVVTAGKFDAEFTEAPRRNRLTTIHGAPSVRVVNSNPGQPDDTSTSDSIDAVFLPQGGIESIVQRGKVTYSDGQPSGKQTQAWADSARYTPADQFLLLTGNPRVANGGMATTANAIRINRATGTAVADGDVKSTYSDLQEQPNGALLASASPIHVTARTMTARNSPVIATYTGNARLWQDANVVEAPSIEFDRGRRFLVAQGTAAKPVQTILVPPQKTGTDRTPNTDSKSSSREASPITITALKLTYADADRTIHYEGGVNVKGADFTASAKTLSAYLLPHGQTSSGGAVSGPGQVQRLVAEGSVLIQQSKRRAEGQKLVYTSVDDQFVLTGGPPSIFDAEQGKITGVSLTFFRRDDRVLVEGEASNPVVTTTRVAR